MKNQKSRGKRRKLKLIDHLRGWHWEDTKRVRNWCGCVI